VQRRLVGDPEADNKGGCDEAHPDGEARSPAVEHEGGKTPDVDEDVHRGDREPDDEACLVNPDPGSGPLPGGEEVKTIAVEATRTGASRRMKSHGGPLNRYEASPM